MKRYLFFTGIIISLFSLAFKAGAADANILYGNLINGLAVGINMTGGPVINRKAPAPIIIAGPVTGSITSCAGSASASPDLEQVTISGSNLPGDILASVPTTFEISLSANGPYGNFVTLQQSGGSVGNTVVYVRSAATAAPNNYSGYISLISGGTAGPSVPISETIHDIPTINPVFGQSLPNGSFTTPVNFTGTAKTYTWTNNTPGIGLAASGTGDIASFMAVNNTSSPVVATVTATPVFPEFVYVVSFGSNQVVVLNTVTGATAATIGVGSGPSAIAQSPDGSRVYVSNNYSNDVSVIDTKTNTLVITIPVSTAPLGLVVSPDGSKVYVANSKSSTISVISTATNKVIATIALLSSPFGLAISPDGTRLYSANGSGKTVSIIDVSTQKTLSTVYYGSFVSSIIANPNGNAVYVIDYLNKDVSVINTTTGLATTTIPVGSNPLSLSINPNGSLIYVANSVGNSVTVIDALTNAVVTTIPVGTSPECLSLSADGNLLYVGSLSTSSVTIINATTNAVITTLSVNNASSLSDITVNGTGCTGAPVTFTITVKPTSLTAVISAGAVTGGISVCQGTASASPDIEKFTAAGTGLTADIMATASAGFEVSLTPGSGFGSTVTLLRQPGSGTVNSTPIYVRASATARLGNISGRVTLTSAGTTSKYATVSALVTAVPTVAPVGPQALTSGNFTQAVNFTGSATAFDWVNDTPSIGLPAGGVGNIPSFVASNTSTSPVTATITVTPVPAGKAYIASISSNALAVVNTATDAVVTTIPVGASPYGVCVSPDGSHVYVTNQGTNDVSVINTATNMLQAKINVGSLPAGIVVSPDGKMVYVVNTGSNSVSVIDVASNMMLTAINVGSSPIGIAISPDGSMVYVSNNGTNDVSVISTTALGVVKTIPVGTGPLGIAAGTNGNTVYVANSRANTVSVINTVTNTVTAIAVGTSPSGLAISPDGLSVYVSNSGSTDVSAISTLTNSVIATIPVGAQPYGLSVTPDGTRVFVSGVNSNYISVISVSLNTVIFQIQVGLNPNSLGNFIEEGSSCPGMPVTFTITVNPAQVPTITVSPVTGTIAACAGTASVNRNLQQFMVSGVNLTSGIVIKAPNNFEISFAPGGAFGGILTLAQTGGTVNSTVIYIRSSALAQAGAINGKVSLISGSVSQNAVVTGSINPLATVAMVNPLLYTNGAVASVNFTGTATDFTWTNNMPGIGLAASGTGNIAPFTVINTGSAPVVATITVTPVASDTGCSGAPADFTITVNPSIPFPVVTAASALSPLTTVYGTASASATFTVSGANMTAGVLISPPIGFEVSTDDINFSSTVTTGAAGTIAPATVYIRLASSSPVSNNYSGNIALTSAGAAAVNLSMPVSTVTPAPLIITAGNKSKTFGNPNPVLTVSYNVFVNNDGPAQLTTLPLVTTLATATSPAGQYPITVTGAASPNYNITQLPGTLTVNPAPPAIVIPNAFTPNGDGVNDNWNIKNLDAYPNCTVQVFNRYGESVFYSIGYGVHWNGSYNGSSLPTGAYYYIISLQNSGKALSGYVAIIR